MADITIQTPIRSVYKDGSIVISNVKSPINNATTSYSVVTEWYDGSPMDDTKVDPFGVYTKYKETGEYLRENKSQWGELFLEMDTVADLRAMSPYNQFLIKIGYYKGVRLGGYYSKGDTPAAIDYFLSDLALQDNNGSVFKVNNITLFHDFKGYIDLYYFGAKGDGVTPTADNLINAINSVETTLTTIEIPDNTVLEKTINIVEKPIILRGLNIINSTPYDDNLFTIEGRFDYPQAITSFSNTNNYTLLTVADTAPFKKGDIIKVISNDEYTNRRYRCYKGEFGIISEIVDSNNIRLCARLVNTYTTNPKVARLADIPFECYGMKFVSNSGGRIFNLLSLNAPKFNGLSTLNHQERMFDIASCFGYSIDFCDVHNLKNNPSENAFGYFVSESSGQGGCISNSRVRNVRHFVTTNVRGLYPGGFPNKDFRDYGETLDLVVNDGIAIGCTDASFDTHENGGNIVFNNCTSFECQTFGFHIRSRGVTLNSCTVFKSVTGLQLDNYYNVDNVGNVVLNDCSFYTTGPVITKPKWDADDLAYRANLTINGGIYESTESAAIRVYRTDLAILGNPRFKGSGSASRCIELNQSTLYGDSLYLIDAFETTNARQLIRLEGNSEVDLRSVDIESGTTGNTSISFASADVTSPNLDMNNNTISVKDILFRKGTSTAITAGTSYASGISLAYRNKNNISKSSVVAYTDSSAVGGVLTLNSVNSDPHVFHRIGSAVTAITSISIPNTNISRVGQLITIINLSSTSISLPSVIQNRRNTQLRSGESITIIVSMQSVFYEISRSTADAIVEGSWVVTTGAVLTAATATYSKVAKQIALSGSLIFATADTNVTITLPYAPDYGGVYIVGSLTFTLSNGSTTATVKSSVTTTAQPFQLNYKTA